MTDESTDESLADALIQFGDMLRRKRQNCRWTFYSLEEKTGIPEDVISKLERGKNVGTEQQREKLCDFLGLDIDTFPRLLRTRKAQIELRQPPAPSTTGSANIVDFIGYRENGKRSLHIQRSDNPRDDG